MEPNVMPTIDMAKVISRAKYAVRTTEIQQII